MINVLVIWIPRDPSSTCFTRLSISPNFKGSLIYLDFWCVKGLKSKKTQGQKQKRKQISIGKEQIKGEWLNLLHYDLTYWQIFFPHILHLNYTQLLNYQILMELFLCFNKTWRESNFYQPSRAWFCVHKMVDIFSTEGMKEYHTAAGSKSDKHQLRLIKREIPAKRGDSPCQLVLPRFLYSSVWCIMLPTKLDRLSAWKFPPILASPIGTSSFQTLFERGVT